MIGCLGILMSLFCPFDGGIVVIKGFLSLIKGFFGFFFDAFFFFQGTIGCCQFALKGSCLIDMGFLLFEFLGSIGCRNLERVKLFILFADLSTFFFDLSIKRLQKFILFFNILLGLTDVLIKTDSWKSGIMQVETDDIILYRLQILLSQFEG